MLRIGGKDLPKDKNIEFALTYIYGIGRTRARDILAATKIDIEVKAKDLSEDEEKRIRDFIENNYKIEADLRLEIDRNLRRLKDIGSYRGTRHLKGLPTRGQHTRKNSRTRKGKKVTVGSGRSKAPAPK
jgi:small subunit ribosomal protein S13